MDTPAAPDTATGPGRLRTQAYLAIRTEILGHRIKPLSLLREPQLAAKLGMSRTPVRSALEMLVSDGLVRWEPGVGYAVEQLTARTITEVFELRTAIETFAVRGSKNNGMDGLLDKYIAFFEHYADRADTPLPTGEWALLEEADRTFHENLVKCLRNSLAVEVSGRVALRAAYLRGWAMNRPGRVRDSMGEHLAIAQALHRNENETAATVLAEHLETGRSLLVDLLAQWDDAEPIPVLVGGAGMFGRWLTDDTLDAPSVRSLIAAAGDRS